MTTSLDASAEARLTALIGAPLDKWIALSEDESRIVAEGDSFGAVAEELERIGENNALVMRVPDDWIPRIL